MMAAMWVVFALVAILAAVFTGRTLMAKGVIALPAAVRPRTVVPLLSVDVKRQIEETESEIRRKTETVAQIIAQREGSGAPKKKKTEVSTDPLNETSFMRAISAKVEEVKRISGVKS